MIQMKQHFKSLAGLLYFLLFISSAFAQQPVLKESPKKTHSLIQFSGVVVEGDSLRPVPYASVMIHNSFRGTVCDYFGYFSFVAQLNDTIEFSAIGYRDAYFIIPDTLTTKKYSLIQVLATDPIYLHTTEVYPWPSKEQFKQAFLQLNIPDDDLARAQKNMD